MTVKTRAHSCNRPQLLRGFRKRIAAAIALILSLQLLVGCGQIYRARWPEDTRPDMVQVTNDIKAQVTAIERSSNVRVGLSEDGLNFNGVRIYLDYDSINPEELIAIANFIESLAAPKLVPLKDDGTLSVVVRSANYDTMPHGEFYPNHGTNLTWDELARIYGLKRPNPWRR